MKISIRTFNDLSHEEIYFVFCMLRKYGGMRNPIQNGKNRKTDHRKFSKNITTNEFPDLNNLDCKSWDDCTDEKFLTYKAIMEKTKINE